MFEKIFKFFFIGIVMFPLIFVCLFLILILNLTYAITTNLKLYIFKIITFLNSLFMFVCVHINYFLFYNYIKISIN